MIAPRHRLTEAFTDWHSPLGGGRSECERRREELGRGRDEWLSLCGREIEKMKNQKRRRRETEELL